MNKYPFSDELTLASEAEKLGKKAVSLGRLPSLTIHFFPDCWQFSIPNQKESDPLTPEEAYLCFKKLLEDQANTLSLKN